MIGKHKRGDAFDYSDQFVLTEEGVEQPSLVGWTGASQIRHVGDPEQGILPDTLVATLEFTWLDASQRLFRLRHVGSTTAWPLGMVKHDIELTSPGGVPISTDTEYFKIVEDVTHG